MANTTVKGKFNVVAENGDVQTIYPKTTGDQVLVDRSSNASVIPNDVANLQHIVNKMGSLALKSKVETSDFTTGTMIGVAGTGDDPCANLKANTDAGKIADALIVKNIESRVDTLENSNLVTVDELDAGIYTEIDSKSPIWFDEEQGNLYNYEDDTYGYYIDYQNGEILSQIGYYVTDYIDVLPRKIIYKNYVGFGAFYDAEHNYISGHEYAVQTCIVPTRAKYYRTAFSTAQRTTAYISYTNEYTPYTGESVFNVTNNDFVEWLNNRYQAINAYAGKKIAVLGDSWSDTSNNTCTKRWHDWIAEKTGAVIQCAAVSGTGYKFGTDNDNTVSNFMQQALTIDSDTDLVIIFGSGNDCGTGSKSNFDFGTAKDKTADTLGGCMNITLDNIQSTAPNARILMVSPAPWINYDPWWEGAATGRMGVYTELMKNVAAYRGIRFKDMYHSSDMHPQNTDFKATFYNSDGVHLNNAGQKRIYPDILAEIKAVLPEFV